METLEHHLWCQRRGSSSGLGFGSLDAGQQDLVMLRDVKCSNSIQVCGHSQVPLGANDSRPEALSLTGKMWKQDNHQPQLHIET